MNQVVQFFSAVPLFVSLGVGGVLAAAAGLSLFFSRRKKGFLRLLEEGGAEGSSRIILEKYSYEFLCRRSRRIVDAAEKTGHPLPVLLGLQKYWIKQLDRKSQNPYREWLLRFFPEEGLFPLFEKALTNPELADYLETHIRETGEFRTLRGIAQSGRGREFDGAAAAALFSRRMDEIREMTGDPEWPARYLALKVLLHDDDPRSARAVWDSFEDSHGFIRTTVAREIDRGARPPQNEEEEAAPLYDKLKALLIDDPVPEVRRAAKERILRDFADSYSWTDEELRTEQTLRLLQLSAPGSSEDQDFAMQALDGDNLELRQTAARYLQAEGVLSRLFRESHLSDRENLERNAALLRKATEVNVTGFLKELEKTDNPGSLLIASQLLKEVGNRPAVRRLAAAVFALPEPRKKEPALQEIYRNTLDGIALHGDDATLGMLKKELKALRGDTELLGLILEKIPYGSGFLLLETLVEFLKDPDFPLQDDLRQTLLRMPEAEVLETALDIIHTGRPAYPHQVRIQALKLLGELGKDYCLQTILENLSILPLEEGKEFARMLDAYAGELFEERAASILNSVDAHSRASLIVCLPATGKKSFLKNIKEGLGDASPEVRIACIWALIDYKETKQLNKAADMLRDPVEEVRREVAKALGTYGTESILKNLEALLNDENEADSVKKAAVLGLSCSTGKTSIDILVRKIEEDRELKAECRAGLAAKLDKKSLSHLVENFKDANPQLREDLSLAIGEMGVRGEELMIDLLREDIPSLHDYIAQVLESTGCIESRIRRLRHRDPKIRKAAADFLSAVKTKAAFRGIVLAARDPDRDVRISVAKALEALNTEEGKGILEELQQDPDKKVRKYTLWALERVKTKSL